MIQPTAHTTARIQGWAIRFKRAADLLRTYGFRFVVRRARPLLHKAIFPHAHTYRQWIARFDTVDADKRRQIATAAAELPSKPTISLIVPACSDWSSLSGTLSSVQAQPYRQWQLLIGASESPSTVPLSAPRAAQEDRRIRFVTFDEAASWALRANRMVDLAGGEFIAFLDPGDSLHEHTLYWLGREIAAHPDADLLFSDEDTLSDRMIRTNPWFKPDWNPALMLSCNAFGRLGAFRRSLVQQLGGLRPELAGAEEYDLVLRCARASAPDRIRHIRRVLYHRRSPSPLKKEPGGPNAAGAAERAAAEHLAAQGVAATVRATRTGNQVAYALPRHHPHVTVIVPTTARPEIAEPCFASLLERTSYDRFDVLAVASQSTLLRADRAALLNRLAKDARFTIVAYPDRPFNFSWVNNYAAAKARGTVLCLLNDDTEVITPDWLTQLVARLCVPGIGAASPTLYYPDGAIQHAGVILGLRGIAGHACHRIPRGHPGYFGRAVLEQDVSCVTAACMAIRADLFREIGGFDETMPLAYNDVDLCLRLRRAGWRIIWTPSAELLHRESASFGWHDVGARAAQFVQDVERMRERWGAALENDPFYNPNLSLDRGHELGFPPRPGLD